MQKISSSVEDGERNGLEIIGILLFRESEGQITNSRSGPAEERPRSVRVQGADGVAPVGNSLAGPQKVKQRAII